MPLEEHLVAGLAVVLAAEEVVEPDLVQAGRRRVGRDVAADAEPWPVGPGHHDGGVPPDVGADPALDVLVAGEPGLALGRDRVDVVGAAQPGHADLLLAGTLQQPEHHVARAVAAAGADHAVERLHPLTGLVRVDIGQLGGQPVTDDGVTLASGGHEVSSPSVLVVRRSAASCDSVVQTNRGTCARAAHLYPQVTSAVARTGTLRASLAGSTLHVTVSPCQSGVHRELTRPRRRANGSNRR